MTETRLPIAKLSRPRLYDPIARHRLFLRLDQAHAHPLLWIVGPPGAGKTTLLATYLQSRRDGGIWYQVDSGDNDAPSFFYHLRLAERTLARATRKAPLPLMTAEYLADIPTFCRRFLRALFARMPVRSFLVFDNFQELDEGNPLQRALAQCVAEIPGHVNVVILSRSAPPAAFSSRVADGSIARVEWDDLRMTLDETRTLIASRLGKSDVDPLALQRDTGGWAAGLTLLIERLRQERLTFTAKPAEAEVFDYFASQLFERASNRDQDILLRLSLVPHFTADIANRVAEDDSAGRLLEQLYKRNLFTDRRHDQRGEPVYQFHALFRNFLRYRAQKSLTAPALQSAKRLAADVMERAGEIGEAAELHMETEDWDQAIRLTLTESPGLLGQGRRQVLLERIARLPPERAAREPWLLYWKGIAQLQVDPAAARPALLASHGRAVDLGDRHCMLQAAAAITQTHILEYSHLAPLDEWLPVLEQSIDDNAVFPDADAELAVVSALLIAISYRQPGHRDRSRCIARVYELVLAPGEANLRLIAVGFVLAACLAFFHPSARSDHRSASTITPSSGLPCCLKRS